MNERDLFTAALQIGDPAGRAAWLDHECGSDPALRQRVDALLLAYESAGSLLENPAAESTVDESGHERAGAVIGPYKLLQPIGEGGMGVVWMAEQSAPVQRKVALKIIRPGLDSRQVLARFEAERQALALMDHPNIAKVLEAGTTPEGRPFFAMELVKGLPITRYCDEHRLTPRQRLELFLPVCHAIQHAHQKGIIHRDIKPSNVLVGLYDGRPVVKVIDFGVAKAAGPRLTDKTLFTEFGAVVGTLQYMSPEQAQLDNLDVDTRSDVYALGVLLYELLTGSTPLERKRCREVAFLEVLRLIREEESTRPSTRLSTAEALPSIAAQRHTEPAKLSKLMRGELDWIVMKTLEKDRKRRYESASGLAADVQRYLNDEAVQACPPSATYRLRKFARRNKASLAIGSVLMIALFAVFGVVVGTLGWQARDRASREAISESQVVEALALAEPRLREGNPSDVLLVTSARQAEAQLASGLVRDELRERVDQLLADLQMLKTLEEIRLAQTAVKRGRFDITSADSAYAQAFRAYGIGVDTVELPVVAAQIRGRAIAVHLAAALDDWAMARLAREKETGQESWKHLLEVARSADPDPWRVSLREALGRKTSQDDFEKLAASAPIQELPATTLTLLGKTLADNGAKQLAVRVLRAAQQQNPADFWINHTLAWTLHRVEPPQLEETVAYYRAALARRWQSPGVYLNLGAALHDLGRLDEAIACNRAALRLKYDYAEAHCNLGNALWLKGRSDEAIACQREAIRLKPELFEAQFGLANELTNSGRWGEAIPYYQNAIRLNKDDVTSHYELGTAHFRLGRMDEAIACLQEAVRLKKDYAEAHTNLGNALQTKGCQDEAIACYRKAITHKPSLFEAYANLGNALASRNQLDEAIAEYRTALRLKTDSAESHYNLGNALSKKGRLDEAIACYRTAIKLDPKNSRAYVNLGNALFDKDQPDEAIACYHKAIKLDPGFALAHNGLGISLAKSGKHDDALACFRRAFELDPRFRANFITSLNRVSWLLATSPGPKTRNPQRSVELAKEAVHLAPKERALWNTLGVAHYRAADWKAAVEALSKSMELQQGGDGNDWFFLAMAHWQLGNKTEARRWYDRAAAWMGKSGSKSDELGPIRVEARQLMGAPGDAKPKQN